MQRKYESIHLSVPSCLFFILQLLAFPPDLFLAVCRSSVSLPFSSQALQNALKIVELSASICLDLPLPLISVPPSLSCFSCFVHSTLKSIKRVIFWATEMYERNCIYC